MAMKRWLMMSTVLVALLGSVLLSAAPSHAVWYNKPFTNPEWYEMQYRPARTVKVPMKLNLNTASVKELQTLPGVSEDVALKVISARPFLVVNDINRVQSLSPQARQLLIQEISPYVVQPLRPENRMPPSNWPPFEPPSKQQYTPPTEEEIYTVPAVEE